MNFLLNFIVKKMGESKYNNYKCFLEENGYKLLYSLTEFINTQKISFECKNGHVTTLTATTFANKKCNKLSAELCSMCTKPSTSKEEFEIKKSTIFELNGHVITEINGRSVVYTCGNCNETRTSTFGNLKRSTKFCGVCTHLLQKKVWKKLSKNLNN